MTNSHKVPTYVPVLNRLIVRLLGAGVPMGPMQLVTIRGRISGKPRTTPVGVFEHAGHRWLVATFGETEWTRNLRAARQGTLSHGRRHERITAVELPADQAGPVLQDVLGPRLKSPLQAAFLQRFYALTPTASASDFVREARAHPVFELRPSQGDLNVN